MKNKGAFVAGWAQSIERSPDQVTAQAFADASKWRAACRAAEEMGVNDLGAAKGAILHLVQVQDALVAALDEMVARYGHPVNYTNTRARAAIALAKGVQQ